MAAKTSKEMRTEDIRALFHAGSRHDADDFDRALREARTAKSRAAMFSSNGREFMLLQSLDNDTWQYRAI